VKGKSRNRGPKESRKKRRTGKGFLLFILIGIALSMLILYRQKIFNTIKTKPEVTKRIVSREHKNVVLYFSDEDGEYLIGEKDTILKKERVEEEAKELITELIRGPKGKLIPTLPPQTKLLNLQVDEKGVAKVSFSKAFTGDHPGGSSAEIMTVYSVVNSLTTNFPRIKRVQILVEGKEIESIAGHLSLMRPISPKPDLIRNAEKSRGNH
jgi:spore germination protein GerM